MSIERQLLKEIYKQLAECEKITPSILIDYSIDLIFYEIENFLAHPEQEPVRKVVIGDSFMIDDTKYIKAREPLSDERKLAIIQECKDANGIRSKSFIGLCDAIEKAHGIGCDEWYWRYSDE